MANPESNARSLPSILILGVGNILMGDEGVGVHAIERLERESWPAGVRLLDGGTGGFHLLSWLQEHDRVILVDATRDGQPPGTVAAFRPRLASEFPPALGAHDIGLKDLISAAALVGPLPDITVITISVDALEPMCMRLSPAVAAALSEVVRWVHEIVDEFTVARAALVVDNR